MRFSTLNSLSELIYYISFAWTVYFNNSVCNLDFFFCLLHLHIEKLAVSATFRSTVFSIRLSLKLCSRQHNRWSPRRVFQAISLVAGHPASIFILRLNRLQGIVARGNYITARLQRALAALFKSKHTRLWNISNLFQTHADVIHILFLTLELQGNLLFFC